MRETHSEKPIDEPEKQQSLLKVLRSELAANTQALGHNTLAVEEVAASLKVLASHTGEWRDDDRKHHKGEEKWDKKKVKMMKDIIKNTDELINLFDATKPSKKMYMAISPGQIRRVDSH